MKYLSKEISVLIIMEKTFKLKIAIILKITIVMTMLMWTINAKAQLNPLSGLYYTNQYLGNPAMAGIEEGLKLNLGHRQQWSRVPSAPKTQSLSADYGTGKKVGLGLNLYNDEAGLFKRTRTMVTYSYHLPFNGEGEKISFGISLGFMNERVLSEKIDGDQNDLSVTRFNKRETYIDGDFGIAYTSKRLTLQAAIPNLKNFIKKDNISSVVDRSTFYSAISYKLEFPNALDGMEVEPKLAFRGVKGFKNIWDLGANVSMADKAVSVMAVYHSSESATIGMGVAIRSLFIFGNYTTNTAELAGYTNGNFELGLRLSITKNNQADQDKSN